MVKRLRRLSARFWPAVERGRFWWRWRIRRAQPAALPEDMTGQVLPWSEDWIRQLDDVLGRLPKKLVRLTRVRYLAVVEDLCYCGTPHDGIACEPLRGGEPRWIALEVFLFTLPTVPGRTIPKLPALEEIFLEEVAHIWDFRLEAEGSPFSSMGAEWRSVEFDAHGRITPFDADDRRPCGDRDEQSAEDWALAIKHFVFRPGDLRLKAPERYDFVQRLFARYGIRYGV